MAVQAKKCSAMTLFSGTTDIFSHQVRLVLAEKAVNVEIKQVESDLLPQDLIQLNPSRTLPILVDREITLYNSRIIIEYLEERFPHPPLMPVYPVARGTNRLMMHRVEQDLYTLKNIIETDIVPQAEAARIQLREELLAIARIFDQTPYFMSAVFSLVDCYLAPLLWRLPKLGIDLYSASSKEFNEYMKRIFERKAFRTSLTEAEREMRQLKSFK
ncbi:MAG: stringent starvation protein SspA [Candidatus Dasytiphilus stammeri]